ncbi:ceramide kinase-like isoform X1 [Brienomyrus brachyistius]|uniref:ceramide kinase-like isoform X1 n=1 Tax=Brienomyrus brachyistius TaxID=42636 RepID=UPI0020B38494|nr:ceramide kinase-like isoform X1 [Brienomyrus brachyistius]
MEKQRVLSSQLLVKNRVFEVALDGDLLSWRELVRRTRISGGVRDALRAGFCLAKVLHRSRDTSGSRSVAVSEIVAVRETEPDSCLKEDGRWQKMAQMHPCAFTVSYVERGSQHRWRCADVTFHCPDGALCQRWVQAIKEQLSLLTSRPKRLLVYINPYGGKQQGKRIYEQKVAPLFARASISTEVIVTERANHARDHLNTEADLKRYSGVVCVGGDGMFSEVIHGLLARTQRDAGVDQNCADESLVPCTLRVGIIPAGSTDCICYATVGINDPITSALHIIVGDSQPMDVCSVHHNNTFLRYSVSLLGYGFYGDVLADSERKRWMGPSRYDISGVKTFLTHNYYEGTVSFLPAQSTLGSPRDKTRCSAGCYVCLHSGQLHSQDRRACEGDEDVSGREDDGGGGWQVLRGKFLAINSASMSCACPRSPKGLSPAAHLADGTADLILVRKCSRLNFLRHLLRHTSKDDQFDLDFVEVHRVRRFRFTPRHCESELDLKEHGKTLFGHICRDHPACGCTALNSSWNCDGEILQHAAIDVGVHCQLIRLFARGVEEQVITEDMRGLNAV